MTLAATRPTTAADTWLRDAAAVLARVAETQADAIETASRWCADAIAADGLVHLFGTGHSRIPVEEMFPRYGSYPGFNPIAELSMTFHTQVVGANGQRQAMFIERMPGLAEVILANFRFGPSDVMMVFSASGTDRRAGGDGPRREGPRPPGHRGHVRGRSRCRPSPSPPPGSRLLDESRTSSSTCARPMPTRRSQFAGLESPVGPVLDRGAIAIVNAIKSRTAELLVERGADAPGHHPGERGRAPSGRGSCSTQPIESMRGGSPVRSTSRRWVTLNEPHATGGDRPTAAPSGAPGRPRRSTD